jgi:hypothetical protein
MRERSAPSGRRACSPPVITNLRHPLPCAPQYDIFVVLSSMQVIVENSVPRPLKEIGDA